LRHPQAEALLGPALVDDHRSTLARVDPQATTAPPALELRPLDLGQRQVPYEDAWEQQRRLHADRVDDRVEDTVLLLEHPPVFTAGKRTEPQDRPVDGTPVIDVDRGGRITFHGPGQLVGYPILKLPEDVYVVDYLRRLEEALIRTCADLGLHTGRVRGRSGVWRPADDVRPERKLAALGVRVARKVTMHGFALNCDVDLSWYDAIVPCGIADAGVTSLSMELGRRVDVREAADACEPHLRELFSWHPYTRSPDLPRPAEPKPVTYGLHPLSH
jgi:lipoyl(octanoyl) transferase